MIKQPLIVVNRLGLHARAAAKLVRTAEIYQAQIKLERTDLSATADAKSILGLLMLQARRGIKLQLIVEGADELEAAHAVAELFASGFGEEVLTTENTEIF